MPVTLLQTDLANSVETYLERIRQQAHLNAFVEVYADEARANAARIADKIATGTAGRLAGKVISLKDVLSHAGHRLQGGSKILEGYVAPYTATAVQRLLDEDALVIGRTNCDEFAMGSSNENSHFGPALNAADISRVPGGSSGGAAVSVQAGLCDAALGTDTGGSVRQPASFCGIYGLKPSYGRVSRWGLAAYGSSFDCIGPMGSNLQDLALLLEVMAGPDEHDTTCAHVPVPAYTQELAKGPTERLRIGVLRQAADGAGLDADVAQTLARATDALRAAGHSVEVYDFDLLDYLLPTYYILTTAEASSNLSRYDGVRYGYRANTDTLEQMYKRTRSEGFGPEVRRRIMLGNFVLSADYYDAYFTKAQRVRRLIRNASDALMARFDVLLTPTAPTPAFTLGAKSTDPLEMFLADIFTVQANLTGQPAISVPAGKNAAGLPIGLQLTAARFNEASLLWAAAALERAVA